MHHLHGRALLTHQIKTDLKHFSADVFDSNSIGNDMEDKLFTSVINNDKHVLSHILPDPNNHTYDLKPRRHELTLAIKGDARNVFERQLFKDIY